jgi:hypothetical protein
MLSVIEVVDLVQQPSVNKTDVYALRFRLADDAGEVCATRYFYGDPPNEKDWMSIAESHTAELNIQNTVSQVAVIEDRHAEQVKQEFLAAVRSGKDISLVLEQISEKTQTEVDKLVEEKAVLLDVTPIDINPVIDPIAP